MNAKLPVGILAELPEGEVFNAHIRKLSDYDLNNSVYLRQLISKMTLEELQRRSRKTAFGTTCSYAMHSVNPDYLSWLYETDKRKSVKAEISFNPHTPLEVIAEEGKAAARERDWKRFALMLDTQSVPRLLLAARRDEQFRQHMVTRIVSGNYLAPRFGRFLTSRRVETWVSWLGADHNGQRLLTAIVTPNTGITPSQAVSIAECYGELEDSFLGEMLRKQLSAIIVNNEEASPGELLERFPWPSLAAEYALRKASKVSFGMLEGILEEHARDGAATAMLRTGTIIDEALCNWLSRNPSNQRYINSSYSRCTVDDSALTALKGILEKYEQEKDSTIINGKTVEDVLSPTIISGTIRQKAEAISLCSPEAFNRMNSVARSTIERLDAVEFLELAQQTHPALIQVNVMLTASWLRNQDLEEAPMEVGDHLVNMLTDYPDLDIMFENAWGVALKSRDNVIRLLNAVKEHPLQGGGRLRLAMDAEWWLTPEGAVDMSLRRELLLQGETSATANGMSFWHAQSTGWRPRMLERVGMEEAQWMLVNAPFAVECAAEGLDYDFLDGDLTMLEELLLPTVSFDWAQMDSSLCKSAVGYLQGVLGEDAKKWEVALNLLPSWTGTLKDLAKASGSLA